MTSCEGKMLGFILFNENFMLERSRGDFELIANGWLLCYTSVVFG